MKSCKRVEPLMAAEALRHGVFDPQGDVGKLYKVGRRVEEGKLKPAQAESV